MSHEVSCFNWTSSLTAWSNFYVQVQLLITQISQFSDACLHGMIDSEHRINPSSFDMANWGLVHSVCFKHSLHPSLAKISVISQPLAALSSAAFLLLHFFFCSSSSIHWLIGIASMCALWPHQRYTTKFETESQGLFSVWLTIFSIFF